MIQETNHEITESIHLSSFDRPSETSTFSNGDYVVYNTQGAGYVYDANGTRHYTSLFDISASHEYNGYCVDVNTLLQVGSTYKEASEAEINTLFSVQKISLVREILNISFPFIKDLIYLAQVSGATGLTAQEAVIATQAAIWSITASSIFKMGTAGNSENVLKFYNYLIDQARSGYDLNHVENIGSSIYVDINSEDAKQVIADSSYLCGPFALNSTSLFTNNVVFSLAEVDDRVSFADHQGNAVTSFMGHDNFYIKVPFGAPLGHIKINACAVVNYGVDATIIISNMGIDASQSCVVIFPLYKELCTTFELCLASLVITKIVEGNCCETLEEVVFELYAENGELIATGTTDEAGVVKFYNLMPGRYFLKEITVPDGYQLPAEPVIVDVKCPVTRIFVNNSREFGRIRIVKYNKQDPYSMLADAEFDLLDADDNVIDHLICDQNGMCTSQDLKSGVYSLVETKAPSGFVLDRTPIKVILDTTYDIVQMVYIGNQMEPPKGVITIIKADECCSDIKIAGAEFDVLDHTGSLVDSMITDHEGKAVSQPLFYGYYTLVETKTPSGYVPLKNTVLLNVDREVVVVELLNQRQPFVPSGRFRINKYDESCECFKPEGAEFDVFDLSGNKMGTITTVLNECAYSEMLPFGTYVLIESKPPKGYAPNSDPFYVTINSSSYIPTVNIPNHRNSLNPKGFLKILAFDEICTFIGVEGLEFILYDKNNEIAALLITNQRGEAYSELIPLGNYRVINTKVPFGYQLIDAPISVSLTHEDYIGVCEVSMQKA